MQRYLLAGSLIALLAALSGCAMCGSPFDYSYSAYGGSWQRVDQDQGRVGSLFDPADATVVGADEATVAEDGAAVPDQVVPPGDEPAVEPSATGPDAAGKAAAPSDSAPAPGALIEG